MVDSQGAVDDRLGVAVLASNGKVFVHGDGRGEGVRGLGDQNYILGQGGIDPGAYGFLGFIPGGPVVRVVPVYAVHIHGSRPGSQMRSTQKPGSRLEPEEIESGQASWIRLLC